MKSVGKGRDVGSQKCDLVEYEWNRGTELLSVSPPKWHWRSNVPCGERRRRVPLDADGGARSR